MTADKPIYLFANWKMYLDVAESTALAKALKDRQKEWSHRVRMAVFPTALAFTEVNKILTGSSVSVGAQNTFWHEKGGYTGEISAPMFYAAGATHAIVGHSERRHVFNESNRDTNQKMIALVTTTALTPVLCVGETLTERNDNQVEEVVEAQLRSAFDNISWPAGKELIVAYEPVWSVGTGESCDPIEAERMCGEISSWVKSLIPEANVVILYGGSVRPDNISQYLAQDHIQGVLVGASSAKQETWFDIIKRSIA